MKAHVGVDADSGLVHDLDTTTAKVHNSRVVPPRYAPLISPNEPRISVVPLRTGRPLIRAEVLALTL